MKNTVRYLLTSYIEYYYGHDTNAFPYVLPIPNERGRLHKTDMKVISLIRSNRYICLLGIREEIFHVCKWVNMAGKTELVYLQQPLHQPCLKRPCEMETRCVGSKLRKKCHEKSTYFPSLAGPFYSHLCRIVHSRGRMHRRSRYRSGDGEGCSYVNERSIWLHCEDD